MRPRSLMPLLLVPALLLIGTSPRAKTAQGRIQGTLTDSKTGKPIVGAVVRAYDDDLGGAKNDELMGEATTNAAGFYSISFDGKNWDPTACNATMRCKRPDVYIAVYVKLQGKLQQVYKSATRDDVEMKTGATFDRKLYLVGALADSNDGCGMTGELGCDLKASQLAAAMSGALSTAVMEAVAAAAAVPGAGLVSGAFTSAAMPYVMAHYDEVFRTSCMMRSLCYRHGSSTYGKSRDACDREFWANSKGKCDATLEGNARQACRGMADAYYTGFDKSALGLYVGASNNAICEYQGPRPATPPTPTKFGGKAVAPSPH